MEIHPANYKEFDFEPPLTDEELAVICHLADYEGDWQMKIRPKISTKTPTAILTSNQFGVALINVLSYSNDITRRVPVSANGQIMNISDVRDDRKQKYILQQKENDEWISINSNPQHDLVYSAHTLFKEKFSNTNTLNKLEDVIKSVVIIPNVSSTKEAMMLADLGRLSSSDSRRVKFLGADYNRANSLLKILQSGAGKQAFEEEIDRVRVEMAGPVIDGSLPFTLTGGAKNIAENPNNARRRRIRGSAGSGKSLGLASRAANLALEGKSVLLMGYNITLSAFLRDVAKDRLSGIGDRGETAFNRVTFTHFHRFLFDVVGDTSFENTNQQEDFSENYINYAIKRYKEQLFQESRGVKLQSRLPRFDAILIDEGQDFRQSWWNFLRDYVLKDDGEMAVVLDRAQDIYSASGWTDGMQGFGQWTELKESFRLPKEVLSIARAVAEDFELGVKDMLPIAPRAMESTLFQQAEIRWLNVTQDKIVETLASEVQKIRDSQGTDQLGEITILCDRHKTGLELIEYLKQTIDKANIEHIFSMDKGEQQKRKWALDCRTMKLKACTVHSYKGWESRNIIYIPTSDEPSLLFIAVTRVKGYSGDGVSRLIVINSQEKFRKYESYSVASTSEPSPTTAESY
jgi:hypothetical protein